jgi:hypothetical protein
MKKMCGKIVLKRLSGKQNIRRKILCNLSARVSENPPLFKRKNIGPLGLPV